MFWKLYKPQALLDTLFDDGWLCLGLAFEDHTAQAHETAAPLQQAYGLAPGAALYPPGPGPGGAAGALAYALADLAHP